MIGRFIGENRFLSNFWYCPKGLSLPDEPDAQYLTVENAYQAAKTVYLPLRAEFQRLSPDRAKRLGRTLTLRQGWESIKLAVMEDLLRQKFTDPWLRRRLLETGTQELVEGNTWGDRFWGVDGTGENHLGKLLMQTRSELAAQSEQKVS